jgi:hypothetical protein
VLRSKRRAALQRCRNTEHCELKFYSYKKAGHALSFSETLSEHPYAESSLVRGTLQGICISAFVGRRTQNLTSRPGTFAEVLRLVRLSAPDEHGGRIVHAIRAHAEATNLFD